MKLKYIAIFFTALTSSFIFFYTNVYSQDIDSLLIKWESRLKNQKLISCNIKQQKKISYLKNKIFIHGKFYFKYPHFFRLEIKGDENYDIYCDGEKVCIIDYDLEEKEVYSFEELNSKNMVKRHMLPLIGQKREEIKKNYKIEYKEDKSFYEVTPISLSSHSYKKIYFKVGSMDKIKWMKSIYKNNDWTETEFSKWKQHDKVSDYFFKYLK